MPEFRRYGRGWFFQSAIVPPCFFDNQRAGSIIPWLQIIFQKAVHAACGHIAQIQGGGSASAEIGGLHEDILKDRKKHAGFFFFIRTGTKGNDAGVQRVPVGYPDGPLVQEGALPADGVKGFFRKRIVDDAEGDPPVFIEPQGYGAHPVIVYQIGGAVDGVQNPVGLSFVQIPVFLLFGEQEHVRRQAL